MVGGVASGPVGLYVKGVLAGGGLLAKREGNEGGEAKAR